MPSFYDEVIVFGVSPEQCLEAMEQYAEELWSSVDEAMNPLWESEEERSRAQQAFAGDSLLLSPVKEHGGAVFLEIDSEADTAAERLSALLGRPTVALQILRGKWCRLVAFDEGRRLGWLFWVDPSSVTVDGEILAAPVASAVGSGGWIGDPDVFEAFLPGRNGPCISDILNGDWDDPADLAEAVKGSLGFGREAGIPI